MSRFLLSDVVPNIIKHVCHYVSSVTLSAVGGMFALEIFTSSKVCASATPDLYVTPSRRSFLANCLCVDFFQLKFWYTAVYI